MLQELIQKLQNNHGLSAEQSEAVVSTVTGFIKEKFPIMKDTIDSMHSPGSAGATANAFEQTATDEKKEGHSIFDKISEMIPGPTGEKIEKFAKSAAVKAEEVFDAVREKASDMFNAKKDETK